MYKNPVESRWKFISVGIAISLVVRTNNFVNFNEPNTPEVMGSFFGAAIGGALLGWVAWWIWSKNRKSL